MERMSVMEARRELSRTINRVAFGKGCTGRVAL